MNKNKITFTKHIYGYKCQLNGQTYSGIIHDEVIDNLINNVYNSSDITEVNIRKQLRAIKAGLIPGLVIHDYKDGGITTITLIK